MTQAEALTILKTGANVFFTGEPGSGKTYTINQYVSYLQEHEIEPAITASTGIAATHIHGMTIHSWSGVGIKKNLTPYEIDQIASNEYVVRRIQKTKVLIIDEVSMLSADTLFSVDRICRDVKHKDEPFGGIQIILVGDFFQLPPISREGNESQFAFESDAWESLKLIVCYLEEQHRQEDSNLLEFLSAVRRGKVESKHTDFLEKRISDYEDISLSVPKLFTHNVDVDRLNAEMLSQVEGEETVFVMEKAGRETLVASLVRGCLSPERLALKTGASVMFTKNNPLHGFANGTLGRVTGFDSNSGYPIVEITSGEKIMAEPMDWVIEDDGKIRAQITQVPLRLAWAITIHKSQGMSLDAAAVDLSTAFEYGQGYVALSRVRTFSGLHILGWNEQSLLVHPTVYKFDEQLRVLSKEAQKAFGGLSMDEQKTMHDNFVTASGGILVSAKKGTKKKLKKSAKSPQNTQMLTLELFQKGMSVDDITKERGLTSGTIFSHLEDSVKAGKLGTEEVIHLIPKRLQKDLQIIHDAFHYLDTDRLTPIFDYFKGEYSYDDLRLARMVYKKENGKKEKS